MEWRMAEKTAVLSGTEERSNEGRQLSLITARSTKLSCGLLGQAQRLCRTAADYKSGVTDE